MNRCKRMAVIAVFALTHAAAAPRDAGDYLIVKMPLGTVTPDSVVWIQWVGSSRDPLQPTYLAPDSGYIYYSRSPGGANPANYRNKVTQPWIDTAGGGLPKIKDNIYTHPTVANPVARRGTAFKPGSQTDMRAGVFYCIVALPLAKDTLVSNEFQILVESPDVVERISPIGTIGELTPTFTWKTNPGVPYYHVILSDEPISFDTAGTIKLNGLSIVWQAITPDDRIVYGAPDPSKTITADPPPLSPASRYTWVVLNNYGNNAAFSSYRSAKIPPGEFTVAGMELKRPQNVYPAAGAPLNSTNHKKFSFSWTNLDEKANTYKIYVYVTADLSGDWEGINAKMTVWQKEVRAVSGVGTMSVEIDAATILTSNKYTWRVIAVDEKGAGTAGDTTSFHYSAPAGTMGIYTRENIVVVNKEHMDTVVAAVGFVQAKVEVLDGSMEAPLLFYTDAEGDLIRARPAGTYRVTAIKDGFENLSKTVVLGANAVTKDTFFLKRPEAGVFGRVVDESNKGINLASVRIVSDRYDTVTTATDALGNFVLNCYAADWYIRFEMTGYQAALPVKITTKAGVSLDFGKVTMRKNPFTLSGVVKNGKGEPLLGVKVRVLRDATIVGETPSTPQSGAFSFAIAAGTYILEAERVGFTSYRSTIDLMSSKNMTITMEARATLVSGYVFRHSWVNDREVFSPITTAKILFAKIGTADTAGGSFDASYGNYGVSLAPGRYAIISSAALCAPKGRIDTVTIADNVSNLTYNDTLQGYATIPGITRMSSTNAAVGDVSVSLSSLDSASIGAATRSAANGYFELGGIPDGRYGVMAGKDGLALDSIQGPDTIAVSGGKPSVAALGLFMKAGDKTIKWVVRGLLGGGGSIKLQSPVLKTIGFADTLARAGAGSYVVNVDASPDSLLDISYHRFVVPESAAVYIDTVFLNVVHRARDTVAPVNGNIALAVRSPDTLDSASLYYKDEGSSSWLVESKTGRALGYDFSIAPPKDGSVLRYYFKTFRGRDIYGYDKESFHAFVSPDTTRLTKFEIMPFSNDTLRLPAGCGIEFFFKGYYGSSFLNAGNLDGSALTWRLDDAQGCVLDHDHGLSAVVTTASAHLGKPPVLTVSVDTAKLPLKSGVSATLSVKFLVSGSLLSMIKVRRIDAKNPQPITTSLADRAEFIAEGIGVDSGVVTVSPRWSIVPECAGSITREGVFKPAKNFLGFVRVIAAVGTIRGEYVADRPASKGGRETGLNVRYLIAAGNAADTVSNGKGVSLIFPPRIVTGSSCGLLDLSIPNTENLVKHGFLGLRMADSVAYDIAELTNASFDVSRDSIRLLLDIPAAAQSDAASGKRRFFVGRWNADSLRWDPLTNSVVAAGGKNVGAAIARFSRFALVAPPPDLSVEFSVSPNPFSPRVRLAGAGDQHGTCIAVKPNIPEGRLQKLDVRIYNVLGDQVWAVEIANAMDKAYRIWWAGTTTRRIEGWPDANKTTVTVPGGNCCRNGRYFIVLTITDYNNKEKRFMKPVILIK